jgi:hypothetical protein
LGGSNELKNLVRLTPEEHYVAHQLLVKIYPGNGKLIWAALAMTGGGNGVGNGRKGNKLYGWLRNQFIKNQTGRTLPEETRRKISIKSKERNQGENHPSFGLKRSPETCARISAALKGKLKGKKRGPFSEEHKANISAGKKKLLADGWQPHFKKGMKHDDETKAKMRAYWATHPASAFDVTVEGVTMPFLTACKKYHIERKIARMRLKRGWPTDLAFKAPLNYRGLVKKPKFTQKMRDALKKQIAEGRGIFNPKTRAEFSRRGGIKTSQLWKDIRKARGDGEAQMALPF